MDREELLQSYIKGYDELAAVIQKADKEMLYYKPAENKWSAVEVVVHITDTECNASVRLRKAIAEPGAKAEPTNQDVWAKVLDYQHHDLVVSLALFQMLRLNNYKLLSSIDDKLWSNTIVHPTRGNVTVEELLKIYTEHIHTHINQIKRNFDAYLSNQPNNK